MRLLLFGEVCRYKARSQEKGIAGTQWRWSTGVWMRIDKRTGQYRLYDITMGGIRYARTLLRMPEPQQWSLDRVKEVTATPWSTHVKPESEVIHHKREGEAPQADELVPVRRLYIRQPDLDQFAYTKACRQCQRILTHGAQKATMTHSDECRARIMAELDRTPEGRPAHRQDDSQN